jgi:glycosyltransferase involved in cell wall biosynthesis
VKGRPVRILFCTQTASPQGGIETWLDMFCNSLDRSRWHPVVAMVRGAAVHRPEVFARAHPALEGVEIDGRGLPGESRVRAVMRCIEDLAPDLFVPLTVADAHEAICRLKARRSPVRYFLAMHGNVPQQVADVRRYQAFVDFSACPGRLTARLVEWAGVPADRIRHIPHSARPPIAERLPRAPGGALRIGYVGRMTQLDKRVLDLIPFTHDLAAFGLPFTLDVVGDGPARQELFASLSPLGSRIRFHGALPPDAVYRDIYPRLDVLVLFSASEAFGLVLLEAMIHGVVPVSSRYVGHRAERLIVDGETGLLFDVGDAPAAAAACRSVALDSNLLARLSRRALARAEDGYTWHDCARQWEAAFARALELPVRSSGRLPPRRTIRGRLDRMRVPAGLTDLARRLRRRWSGVPSAVVGGEEWPWVNDAYDPIELRGIEEASARLDFAEPSSLVADAIVADS